MVSALYVRSDSVYKTLPNVDAWDAERDARNWPGGSTVVAHPPCGQWGRLRSFANVNLEEKSLAVLAVRSCGGVLEHPIYSTLWKACGLPLPGIVDKWGGYTLPILQQWWGHPAEKATWLYIVGCPPENLPEIPFVMGEAKFVVQSCKNDGLQRPHMVKSLRDQTPSAFAEWLIEVAKRCHGGEQWPVSWTMRSRR